MNKKASATLLFLAMVLLFGEYEAYASPGPGPLETVQVTARRTASSTFESARAVSVVSPEDVAAAPAVLPDLLRGQPGVFVQQTTPGQAVPIVRGLKGAEVLHLVDGMRLNTAIFRNAPTQYLALVDAQNVERIEVLRGPASTLHGSDAMGGVVQIITPTPEFAAETEQTIFARAILNSAESARIGRAGVSRSNRDFAWSLGGTYSDFDDRRTGDGTASPTGYSARAADGTAAWRIGSAGRLRVNGQYVHQPRTPRFDEVNAGFGQTEPDSSLFFFEPNERVFAHAVYEHGGAVGFVDDLQVHAAFQQIQDDRRSRAFGGNIERRERNESALTGITVEGQSSRDGVEFAYGFEYYDDRITSARTETDIDTGDVESVRSRFPTGSTMSSVAAFLNNHIYTGNRTALDIGLRYSAFDIELAPQDQRPGAQLDPDDLTGEVLLSYEASPRTRLFTGISRGFRPPNIFDLGTLGERPGNRFNIANPDLGPETILSYEAGLKWLGKKFTGEFVAFRADYDDRIVSIATGDLTDDGRTVVQSQNVARARLVGAEAGLRYQPEPGIELAMSISWIEGDETRADGTEQPADRVPPLNGQVSGTFAIGGNWSLEPLVRFAGSQDRLSARDIGDPRIDPNGTPGWGRVDFQAVYQRTEAWRIGVGIENLFDKTYREHGSGVDAPGFNAILRVDARF